jgi:hypothetical protein
MNVDTLKEKLASIDAETYPGSLDIATEQTCAFQFAQVLRDGRLRQGQLLDDITAHAGFASGQVLQYGNTGRVSMVLKSMPPTVICSINSSIQWSTPVVTITAARLKTDADCCFRWLTR